jgi:hypothetical protein
MAREPRRPTADDIAAAERAVEELAELRSLEENAARHAEALKHVGALLATIRRPILSPTVRELAGLIRSDAKLLFRVHGPGERHAREDLRAQYLRDCTRLRHHIGGWKVAPKEGR